MLMNIVHAPCNHVHQHEVGGAWELRVKKIEEIESQPCPACASKGKGISLTELKRINKEKAEKWGLAPLVGTEKQASYGNDIRVQMMEGLLEEKIAPEPALVAVLNQHQEAKFWIEQKPLIGGSMGYLILLRRLKDIEIDRGDLVWSVATAMGFALPVPPKKRPRAENTAETTL